MYRCSICEKVYKKWAGKCPNCEAFGTFEEFEDRSSDNSDTKSKAGIKSTGSVIPSKKALTISKLSNSPISRTPTGIGELDRVLGGGFVDSEVILFGGEPGSGKSSLSLTVSDKFAEMGKTVLYVSGEESEHQIGLRAARFGISNDNIHIVNETDLETILGHIEEVKPDFFVLDSLQTVATSAISGSIGSVQQSKNAAHILTMVAKNSGISMILVNQVLKSGDFSGSESVQHITDATFMLESDKDSPLKFLRANKNRFGDTTEVGVFQHEERGIVEVTDPSGIFIENNENVSGSACGFISEGIRQIPVEIQSLVSNSTLPQPRKQFNGVNYNRGQIVAAILDKFCKTRLFEKDLFVSTVSGVKVVDPQSDLALAAAILSSAKNIVLSTDICFVGELSLTGIVRGTHMVENKIKEAQRLGFQRIVVPHTVKDVRKFEKNISVTKIKYISELYKILTQGGK